MDRALLRKIYYRLGDDQSREVFKNRLMYSITNDNLWIKKILSTLDRGNELCAILDSAVGDETENVIFGAGEWGKEMYKVLSGIPWKCVIDNNPKAESFEGLPLVKACDFLQKYDSEYIFITSRLYHLEIKQQLMIAGVPEKRIVDIGQMLNELVDRQYFDLEYLYQGGDKETFVDVGCFDGMTSVRFTDWCKTDYEIYAFEADEGNLKKCKNTFVSKDINVELIPKGVWNEATTLRFEAMSNGSSAIGDDGNILIDVTSLDLELKEKEITFIKMDIEGAEKNALIGAEHIIKKNKPKLAISIYHKPEDIWELPGIILDYNPEYKLYLRHYSLSAAETVLYAL